MQRLLIACAMALGLTSVPLVAALACSCAMPAGPAETAAAAHLAFVGTVVDAAAAPKDPDGFGQVVRYAFKVERTSVPIDGDTVEVRALGGDGGASCGFTFGEGERWFVAAHRQEGALETNLCSGNVLVESMSDAELARLMSALPVASSEAPPAEESAFPIPGAVLVGAAAVAGLAAVTFLAFRRDRPDAAR